MLSVHHAEKRAEEESQPPTPNIGMQQLMLTGPAAMVPGMGMGYSQQGSFPPNM